MIKRYARTKSTKKQSRLSYFIVMGALLVVSVVCIFKIVDFNRENKVLAQREHELEAQIEAANVEHDELVAREKYMQTNEYVEDVAKERFGLVYPDEIVIKPRQ